MTTIPSHRAPVDPPRPAISGTLQPDGTVTDNAPPAADEAKPATDADVVGDES